MNRARNIPNVYKTQAYQLNVWQHYGGLNAGRPEMALAMDLSEDTEDVDLAVPDRRLEVLRRPDQQEVPLDSSLCS